MIWEMELEIRLLRVVSSSCEIITIGFYDTSWVDKRDFGFTVQNQRMVTISVLSLAYQLSQCLIPTAL